MAAIAGGDNVLVVGAGPIGLGAAIFARLSGAQVAIFDRDAERAAAAQSIASVAVLPASSNAIEAVSSYTNGDGFDVVLDATGSPAAMEVGFDLVAHGGRYVFVSVVKDTITFKDPDFHRKEMTLFASRNATAEDFERVITAIREGDVPVDLLVTQRTTLAGAVADIPRWAKQKSGLIKALIDVGG